MRRQLSRIYAHQHQAHRDRRPPTRSADVGQGRGIPTGDAARIDRAGARDESPSAFGVHDEHRQLGPGTSRPCPSPCSGSCMVSPPPYWTEVRRDDGQPEAEPAVRRASSRRPPAGTARTRAAGIRRGMPIPVSVTALDVRVDPLAAGLRHAAARGAELHRVREQVPDDLLQPIGIARHRADVRLERRVDAHALGLRRRADRLDGALDRPHADPPAATSSRSLPAMMRETSSTSSTSCVCVAALRSIVAAAVGRLPVELPRRSIRAQPRMALSGVRSSCDSVARNSSFISVALLQFRVRLRACRPRAQPARSHLQGYGRSSSSESRPIRRAMSPLRSGPWSRAGRP